MRLSLRCGTIRAVSTPLSAAEVSAIMAASLGTKYGVTSITRLRAPVMASTWARWIGSQGVSGPAASTCAVTDPAVAGGGRK